MLYDIIGLQNIVLIRDSEDPRKFYPRFNLEDTSSFQDLDDHRYLTYLSVFVLSIKDGSYNYAPLLSIVLC